MPPCSGRAAAGVGGAPLAPSVTAAQFASMLADAQARLLFADGARCRAAGRDAAPHRAERHAGRHAARRVAGRSRHGTGAAGAATRVAVQHHLFQRHHGHAQGHRAIARHALDARDARRQLRLRAAVGDAAVHAAVLEHHAGGVPAVDRLRRHRAPDGQVRRRRLPGAGREAARHAHDAGAGAVPAHHGAAGLRPPRPDILPHEVLHQRALQCRAQVRRAEALARRAGGVLRHDRRRRQLHPECARAPGQAAHRGPAGRGPRHPADRRAGRRGAARRGRRGGRPFARHDDRLPRPAGEDPRGRVVRPARQALHPHRRHAA